MESIPGRAVVRHFQLRTESPTLSDHIGPTGSIRGLGWQANPSSNSLID